MGVAAQPEVTSLILGFFGDLSPDMGSYILGFRDIRPIKKSWPTQKNLINSTHQPNIFKLKKIKLPKSSILTILTHN